MRASEILQQKLDYNNYLKEKISQNLANRKSALEEEESEGYSPLRKLPVVPDLSPIQKSLEHNSSIEPYQKGHIEPYYKQPTAKPSVGPSPIKVNEYIRMEGL